jgi:SAM-dependent methyltransferase
LTALPHAANSAPSEWVCRFAPLFLSGGRILDLACGSGRHALYLAASGLRIEAVDIDATSIALLAGVANVSARIVDLEAGTWPYSQERFDGIVVTNYLHRPLLPLLVAALGAGGVLLYETFAAGNERFGRPRNPDHLLRPGELLETVRGRLRVVAYEETTVERPRPAVIQRICAVNNLQPGL